MINGNSAATRYWIFCDKTVKNVSPINCITTVPAKIAYMTNENWLPSSAVLNKYPNSKPNTIENIITPATPKSL